MRSGSNMTRSLTGTKILSCFLIFSLMAAPSSYVLPYPSFMPGHKVYKVKQIFDKIYGIWCFGSLAQFKYNLKMADKKLVEAKTLFEYGQLLLGVKAIQQNGFYLDQAFLALGKAKKEEKDISRKREIFKEALKKHAEVLDGISKETPDANYWQEEKKEGRVLEIGQEIKSIRSEITAISQRLSEQ